ncbi:hypothetical protein NCG89_11485 [Spongiibacter taiwanensis]|uniref:hypothetical protein n=1 Tax=Spongiibacter taiwanensis TaxID=1748242 RepID=UPI002034C33B|nr:hypothetical protein [Spongiibacter taiwanensis]USA42143.1 hypothetical protein NCG89_11485 [Spongiibacter taiwanensis]
MQAVEVGENFGASKKFGNNERLSYLWCSCLFLVCFSPILEAVLWRRLDVIDELVTVLFLLLLLFKLLKTGVAGKEFVFFLVLIVSVVFFSLMLGRNRSAVEVVSQAFLMSKLFVFFLFANEFVHQKVALAFFKIVLAITFIGVVMNILNPQVFLHLGLNEKIREEFTSINRVGGFQLNANRVAHLFALLSFASAEMLGMRKKLYFVLLIFAAVGLVFTGGRLGMALFVIGLSLKVLSAYKSNIRIVIWFLVSPVFAYIAFYGASIIFFGEEGLKNDIGYFRLFLLTEGGRLALDYFPFGSGLGTYGTKFAYDVGVYQETRVADTFFYRADTALYDCNVASLIGEMGFFFAAMFLILLFRLVSKTKWKFDRTIWLGVLVFVSFSLFFESFLSNSICAASLVLFLFGLESASKKEE